MSSYAWKTPRNTPLSPSRVKEGKMQGNALCAVHVLYGGELKRIMSFIEGARTSMAVAGGMIVVIRLNSGFVPHADPVGMLCPA